MTTTAGDLPAKYRDAAVITFEHHAIKMAAKITARNVNPLTGHVTFTLMPFHGLIHPYPLAFEPPLIEHGVGENNGFMHRWEMLNYAFALPDPADFPALAGLSDDDKTVLSRYAKGVSAARRVLRD
jgi:hypothetical protein